MSIAASPSCTVLPSPTWSASRSRAPAAVRCSSKARFTNAFWCSHRPNSARYTGVSIAAAGAADSGSASARHCATLGTTVRAARRPTSSTTNSASGTAHGCPHRASNSACTHATASGASSSQSIS